MSEKREIPVPAMPPSVLFKLAMLSVIRDAEMPEDQRAAVLFGLKYACDFLQVAAAMQHTRVLELSK